MREGKPAGARFHRGCRFPHILYVADKGEPTPYAWPDINSHFGIIDEAGFPKVFDDSLP